jgi:hypothetical protein
MLEVGKAELAGQTTARWPDKVLLPALGNTPVRAADIRCATRKAAEKYSDSGRRLAWRDRSLCRGADPIGLPSLELARGMPALLRPESKMTT